MKLTRYQRKRLADPNFKLAFKQALIQFLCERLTQTPSIHEEDFDKAYQAFINPSVINIEFMFPVTLAPDDRLFMPMLYGNGVLHGRASRKIAKHWLRRLFKKRDMKAMG